MRIFDGHHDFPDLLLQYAQRASGRAALVITRLKGDVQGAFGNEVSIFVRYGIETAHFGVVFARAHVPAFANDAVAMDQHSTDERIRTGGAKSACGKGYGPIHVQLVFHSDKAIKFAA